MSAQSACGPGAALRDYLASLTLHGIKLGLENTRFLLDAAGNPHEDYPTIHVAGTNGKGSVAAMIGAMLRSAGYRTAAFTSPHIINLNERFQINGAPISNVDLDENIAFFRRVAQGLDHAPTFFELNTAVAFRWFAQARIDAAVIEVGMGGRLDSTNVIVPVAAAITNIDLEHTQYLGDTLGEIAFEKAGILKSGVPAVVGETRPEPRDVILARAAEIESPIRLLDRDFRYSLEGGPWDLRFSYSSDNLRLRRVPLALRGIYQGINAAVAVALAESLKPHFARLGEDAIIRGLASARWPCRLERVLDQPPVIIDVAHNVAGARRLAETMTECVTILAVASDKDAAGMIELLSRFSKTLILTAFADKRALPLEALQRAAGSHAHECADTIQDAIKRGLSIAATDLPLLITGSIYTAGEARQMLMRDYGASPLRF